MEVDSIAPPTLIAFVGYVMNLQILFQRKEANGFPSCLSESLPPCSSSHRSGWESHGAGAAAGAGVGGGVGKEGIL